MRYHGPPIRIHIEVDRTSRPGEGTALSPLDLAVKSFEFPHCLHHAKWSRTVQPAVARRGGAGEREDQNPPGGSRLKRMGDHHARHRAGTKCREGIQGSKSRAAAGITSPVRKRSAE